MNTLKQRGPLSICINLPIGPSAESAGGSAGVASPSKFLSNFAYTSGGIGFGGSASLHAAKAAASSSSSPAAPSMSSRVTILKPAPLKPSSCPCRGASRPGMTTEGKKTKCQSSAAGARPRLAIGPARRGDGPSRRARGEECQGEREHWQRVESWQIPRMVQPSTHSHSIYTCAVRHCAGAAFMQTCRSFMVTPSPASSAIE